MAKTVYARTEKVNDKVLKGQAALVMAAIETADVPQTLEQITASIKDLGLVTRQAPERIASYYLCIFKKQGFVRYDTLAETEDAVEDAEAEDVEENDDVETEDEFDEVAE